MDQSKLKQHLTTLAYLSQNHVPNIQIVNKTVHFSRPTLQMQTEVVNSTLGLTLFNNETNVNIDNTTATMFTNIDIGCLININFLGSQLRRPHAR